MAQLARIDFRRDYMRQWRQDNRAHVRDLNRAWYARHRDEVLKRRRERGRAQVRTVPRKCVGCDSDFLGYTEAAMYCSRQCLARHNSRKRQRGSYVREDGYRMIHTPAHPRANRRGYVLEHRLVMEARLGRTLERWETVHHVDGNRLNNEPGNLELWKGKHGKGVRSRDYHCPGCRCPSGATRED